MKVSCLTIGWKIYRTCPEPFFFFFFQPTRKETPNLHQHSCACICINTSVCVWKIRSDFVLFTSSWVVLMRKVEEEKRGLAAKHETRVTSGTCVMHRESFDRPCLRNFWRIQKHEELFLYLERFYGTKVRGKLVGREKIMKNQIDPEKNS